MTKEVINKYKIYCKKKRWTQEEASERIGCHRAHLSRIFSGERNPSVKLLDKMEEVMKDG